MNDSIIGKNMKVICFSAVNFFSFYFFFSQTAFSLSYFLFEILFPDHIGHWKQTNERASAHAIQRINISSAPT